ncbi:MAG: fibrobacter succinogenes major paralogous domain-containing protein, partial [Bacteroidota bacterium]
ALVSNQPVGMRISILQGSASGTAVYVETQTPTTNANGLASLEIGGGTVVSGNISTIDWANGPYFIKTETDATGGSNYSITGTSQLLSVPYAFFSGNGIVGVSSTGDTLYLGNGTHLIVPGISAANSSGGGQIGITQHTCGATNVHNPTLNYGSMTDQDGNVYKTIVIGTQEWMAENLRARTYRNGVAIPLVTDLTQWAANYNNGTALPMMCWYLNDSATYACPYGRLYNWYAASDVRNLCPTGWHVPSDAEWTTLTTFLGGNVAGGKMKSTGTQYWISPNAAADNSSGFSGLPGGLRDSNGPFDYVGNYGYWWSSTEDSANFAWTRSLNDFSGNAYRDYNGKTDGFSVRCLRD